jgi:hypothetical protein
MRSRSKMLDNVAQGKHRGAAGARHPGLPGQIKPNPERVVQPRFIVGPFQGTLVRSTQTQAGAAHHGCAALRCRRLPWATMSNRFAVKKRRKR